MDETSIEGMTVNERLFHRQTAEAVMSNPARYGY